MNINNDKSTYVAPYKVVLFDALDAFYYADVMDKMEEINEIDDYDKACAYANAIFVIKNYKWDSLSDMNELDDGFDVRVYDNRMLCVYAAHTKYITKWIGESGTDFIFTPAIQKAIQFSIKTHEIYQKQKRKGKDVPYITHPLTVALILSQAGASEGVVVAGILHDTIEDSVEEKKVTKEMLVERFGENVAELVDSVTEKDRGLSWSERKEDALEEIKKFSSDSLLLKSADVISNNTELIRDYNCDGDKTFERFNASKEETLKHTLQVIRTILEGNEECPLVWDLKMLAMGLNTVGTNIFMSKYKPALLEWDEYDENKELECPICGWEGIGVVNSDSHFCLDVSCSVCNKMLLVVSYPLIDGAGGEVEEDDEDLDEVGESEMVMVHTCKPNKNSDKYEVFVDDNYHYMD